MQYLNFGRKYDAGATTDEDLSRFPSKNSVKQAKSMMIKVFREVDESTLRSQKKKARKHWKTNH